MHCSYVIRTGLNFGVDYCAYQSLPSECHSEMCITVVDALRAHEYKQIMMTQGSGSASVHNPASQACWMDELGWRHVTTLTRLIPVRTNCTFLCTPCICWCSCCVCSFRARLSNLVVQSTPGALVVTFNFLFFCINDQTGCDEVVYIVLRAAR